jgi:hypothetical protein
MLSSGVIICDDHVIICDDNTPFFIFPENFTHSSKVVINKLKQFFFITYLVLPVTDTEDGADMAGASVPATLVLFYSLHL